jgi:hypothetical protein
MMETVPVFDKHGPFPQEGFRVEIGYYGWIISIFLTGVAVLLQPSHRGKLSESQMANGKK